MKKNIYKLLAIAVLVIVPFTQLSAQESYLLKDLRVPQILEENPGYSIPYKFHIGFPCLFLLFPTYSVHSSQSNNLKAKIEPCYTPGTNSIISQL